ncbi:hypothetical protein [Flavobacterium sp.]|uniref:hypothetical protein n=1 Tax=Flavobacterium sp. TaxID=239 RepID=UPI001211373B|nr:hypothetical protein [Flavobacterium sp.]RZJ71913.1 MAG: hypothetical protein EOO49_07745 [Flavobacterium sp.]
MRYLVVAFCFIALFSCNKNPKEKTIIDNQKASDCDTILKVLARQSGLNLKDYDAFFVRIESQAKDEITIQVYAENAVENEQKNESTIAWLKLTPSGKELYDITSDPENPKKMHLEESLLQQLAKSCRFEIPEKADDLPDGMLSKETANIKNLSIQEAYGQFLISKEFEDAKLLLPYLPKNDTIVKVGENGLIDIDYKLSGKAIFMTLNYEGGVTEISFEQLGKNVKRQITHSAD